MGERRIRNGFGDFENINLRNKVILSLYGGGGVYD